MTDTLKSVRRQLEKVHFAKLAKDADDDAKKKAQQQAKPIAGSLDLTALGSLTGFEDPLADTATDRAGDVLASLGISDETSFFDQANTRAAEWAAQHAAELVTQIDESTRNMVRQHIADGIAAGAMREDIIGSLGDFFDEDRATLIADHEVATASGQGALAGYREAQKAGVKLLKVWVCDSEPCPICEQNQDEGPIPVEALFPSGDECEVAHVNCLCHTESVIQEDGEDDED